MSRGVCMSKHSIKHLMMLDASASKIASESTLRAGILSGHYLALSAYNLTPCRGRGCVFLSWRRALRAYGRRVTLASIERRGVFRAVREGFSVISMEYPYLIYLITDR